MTSWRVSLFLVGLFLIVRAEVKEEQLKKDFYQAAFSDVERIVRQAVINKARETVITIAATLRLFFHDCLSEVGLFIYLIISL